MTKNKRSKLEQKKIAEKRVNKLFCLAERKALAKQFDLADRYVKIARKISMRYLVPIPSYFKRRFCKHCYSYLLPGENCRIRIHKGKIVIYCYNCGKISRVILEKKG